MVIADRIYGRIRITEPVIAELIGSKPMQRLKRISQDGASHFIQPIRNVTRFEHSVGAWYLSFRYDRPIEEQIASLLHDIPHTAFSHVIDSVIEDSDGAYHDRFTKQVILASEIPEICRRHKVDINKVLNKENYHLLENDLPDISVDRWDYFMRDGYMFGLIPKQTIKLFLSSIKERDQTFYFEDVRIAGLFAIMYLNCGRLIWLDPSSHGSYQLLASAIKLALAKNALVHDDFFQTDQELWDRLVALPDPDIRALLGRLQPGNEFDYADQAEAEFYASNKTRVIDPLVLADGGLRRLSTIIPGLRGYFNEYRERYAKIGVRPLY